ncbi:condensation domain-containing protein [Actinoplanes aureus]|uniref:AMP-binding protein n=1 Tax=Actinoplanes aureus TaxID=2792083 RepID=A0A931BZ44_9ACTN|nr:condensation domain-containing protein [Actinoplanes aureus]MBG0560225.1 AMP-binding protein [Actinoplanes aureus]
MFPLSPQQELVWLHHQIAPGDAAYNAVVAVDLRGRLDTGALKRAVAVVVAHHDGMRLALDDTATGSPAQRIMDVVDSVVTEIDLSHLPPAEAEQRMAELGVTFGEAPFDTGRAPLARWCLVRLSEERHRLWHVEDHLIHDGRSFAVFLEDLLIAYRMLAEGGPPVLAPAVSYREYVEHCASDGFRSRVDRDLTWWREHLAGAELGAFAFRGLAHRVGTRHGYRGAQLRRRLPAELVTRLTEVARSGRGTLFALLFGVFAELTRRHSGGSEVTVGSAVANRPPPYRRMVGMCVNTLPVRSRPDPGWTARSLALHFTTALFDALDHGGAPIQQIVRAVGRSSGALDNPLFRAMFSMNDAALPDVDVPGLEVSLVEGLNWSTSRSADVDVVILPGSRTVGDDDGGALCVWDYSTEFFDEAAIGLLADRFGSLLQACADAPDTPVSRLPMSGPDDPPVILSGVAAASTGPLTDLIRGHAAGPQRPALISGRQTLSYGELVARIDDLSRQLRRAGLERGDVVAAVLPRGVPAVELVLACLAGEFVFAPLPVAWNDDAVVDAVGRLRPACLIAEPGRLRGLADAGVRATAPGDAPGTADPAERDRHPGAAYLIHTSGTGGRRKRVLVPRASLDNAVAGVRDFLELTPADRVLQFADPAFDVFFEEVLPALAAGACVVQPGTAVPDGADLAALVVLRDLSVLNLPTAYVGSVLPDLHAALTGRDHRLRCVVVGGERLPTGLARDVLSGLPGVDLVNAYGVTESTITSTMCRVADMPDGDEVPIGRPLPGVVVVVLGPDGEVLPSGVPGEIALGGPGSRASYLDGDPDGRYVDGIGDLPGRFFRTGDIGFAGRDGVLRFIGRADRQVKVRGHRIEPEEIELAARRLAGGADVAVLPDEDDGVVRGLIGYVETGDPLVAGGLNAALARDLPRYLLPSRWAAVARMPRLPSGKVDLSALRALGAPAATPAAPAVTEADGLLATTLAGFRAVLRRDDIDADADFFVSGGHSLMLTALVTWLHRETGVRPRMADLFEAPTARGVARRLSDRAFEPVGRGG